jgi:hypothetical protein
VSRRPEVDGLYLAGGKPEHLVEILGRQLRDRDHHRALAEVPRHHRSDVSHVQFAVELCLLGDEPVCAVDHHHDFARRQQGRREFGMKEHIHLLPPTGQGNCDLVPRCLAPAGQPSFGDIFVVGEAPEVLLAAIEKYVLVSSIDTQELLCDIAGVDTDASLLVESPQHQADPHSQIPFHMSGLSFCRRARTTSQRDGGER